MTSSGDLVSRLLAAIEQEEQDAPNIHHKDCRSVSYVGLTEGVECTCPVPAAVLRRCAQERLMVEAVQRGIAGHPEPCINYEGQDPKDYSGWDSCERHLQWAPTTLPTGVLDYLARGYGLSVEEETTHE